MFLGNTVGKGVVNSTTGGRVWGELGGEGKVKKKKDPIGSRGWSGLRGVGMSGGNKTRK